MGVCTLVAVVLWEPWPQMSVGRLRVAVLMHCAMRVRRAGVPADVC